MSIFLVRIEHHDTALRRAHLDAHVAWLHDMVDRGFVHLSGPLLSGPLATGAPVTALLVVRAESAGEVFTTMASDPFSVAGVTQSLTITGWNPVFGLLADHSDGLASLTVGSADR